MLALIFLTLGAQIQTPDMFCYDNSFVDPVEVWVVDKDSVDHLPAGVTMQTLLNQVDSSFVGFARAARPQIRQRVLNSTTTDCLADIGFPAPGVSCVEVRSDAEDDVCGGVQNGDCFFGVCGLNEQCVGNQCFRTCAQNADCRTIGEVCTGGRCVEGNVRAYAACQSGRCWQVLCANDGDVGLALTAASYADPAVVPVTMSHEFGHTLGLAHVDASNCAGANTRNQDPDNTCSTFDDSCDGETMCSNTACILGATPQDGDGRGVREIYNFGEYKTRNVWATFFGSGNPLPAAQTTREFANSYAIHQPRIDCARSSAVNDCAMIRHRLANGANNVRVNALNDRSANGWDSVALVDDVGGAATFAPDVAVNTNGTVAWSVVANNGAVQLRRSPMPGGPGGLWASAALNVTAVLPPRVVFLDNSNQVLVFVYSAGQPFLPNQLPGRPVLRAFRFSGASTGPLTQLGGDLLASTNAATPFNALVGEFDVGCRRALVGTADECDVVAIRLGDGLAQGSFTGVPGTFLLSVTPTSAIALNWQRASNTTFNSLNVVTAVVVPPASVGNERMFVAYGRRNTGDTINAALARYAVPGLQTNAQQTVSFTTDAGPCGGSVGVDGFTMPSASTLVGGQSVAWCATCPTPELVGLTLGARSDGVPICF